MAFLRAKPIGVMQMIDQGEQDDKARPTPAPCQRFQHACELIKSLTRCLARTSRGLRAAMEAPTPHWYEQVCDCNADHRCACR